MSLGKGGKGMGKAINHVKRHQGVKLTPEQGIRRPAIKRLCGRAGAKRISQGVYEKVREELSELVMDVLRIALEYPRMRNQKTITAVDIVHSLQQCNMNILV